MENNSDDKDEKYIPDLPLQPYSRLQELFKYVNVSLDRLEQDIPATYFRKFLEIRNDLDALAVKACRPPCEIFNLAAETIRIKGKIKKTS